MLSGLLSIWLWRLLSRGQYLAPGEFVLDWAPYPNWLLWALNWWVPISLLVLVSIAALAVCRSRQVSLVIGGCLHALSLIGLVTLGCWVCTVPMEGSLGAWWMWWIQ